MNRLRHSNGLQICTPSSSRCCTVVDNHGLSDWDNIFLARVPDIRITLPTPDMTSDMPGDISTIIAPDLSLSTVDTEMEIERSLPWTPARISRPLGLVSPGATTIASGQSAVLSHAHRAPLFPGRPRNPSPPSLPGTTGGGDTSTLQLQRQRKEEHLHESFLPELSEGDGTIRVGLGVCVDEFGTFISEEELESVEDSDPGGSPQISLQDALALPIPLLVTPRTSELDLRGVPVSGLTPSRLPARLLRWRNNAGASVARDAAVDSRGEWDQELPELSWHGLDADPFRCSPPPSVPIEEQETSAGGGETGGVCEDVASSRRVDATFRWSTASLEMGAPPHMPVYENSDAHAHIMSFGALSALTRRIREQGRALLRKSHSRIPFPRLPGSSSRPHPPSPLPSPMGGFATALEGGGFGSVRRIGLGIGYSLPSPGLASQQARPAYAPSAPAPASAHPRRYTVRRDGEGTVPAGCYAGLGGGRRGKKRGATQQLQQQLEEQQERERPEGADKSAADGRPVCGSASVASPCDSGSVLILGNPGFGGSVALGAMTDLNVEHVASGGTLLDDSGL